MEDFDLLAFAGLDWLYDRIEARYGRWLAWLVTFAAGLSIMTILALVLVIALRR